MEFFVAVGAVACFGLVTFITLIVTIDSWTLPKSKKHLGCSPPMDVEPTDYGQRLLFRLSLAMARTEEQFGKDDDWERYMSCIISYRDQPTKENWAHMHAERQMQLNSLRRRKSSRIGS